MENPLGSAEEKVSKFFEEVLYVRPLAAAFHDFIVHTVEDQARVVQKHQESIKELFKSFSEEEVAPALRHYIKLVSETKDHHKCRLLYALLEFGVKNNFVNPLLLCETILKSEYLVFEDGDFWCLNFTLIFRIIPGIDYKGVRNLLKSILDKAHGIKSVNNVSAMSQLRAVQRVLDIIFDRNQCLLPSYLILDELQKKMPAKGPYPHWKFASLTTNLIESFRPVAQMVSLSVFMDIRGEESVYGKTKLLPVVGYSTTIGSVWKLDQQSAKAPLRGLLPYKKELLEPQISLIRYVLEQPYSREMICCILGLSKQVKQRCPILEEQFVELIVSTLERSENDTDTMVDGGPTQLLWQHLSSQLIYFVLFQYVSFPHIIKALHSKLVGRNMRKGRDHLMWALLQYISGSIQKNHLDDFLPVLKLYDLLYPETEPLPFPDVTKANSTHALAVTSIWIHLMKKAHLEQFTLKRTLPSALGNHLEYLQVSLNNDNLQHSLSTDYRVPLLCNTYSTNPDCFTRPMAVLVEAVHGNQRQQQTTLIPGPIKPLSVSVLDSLTVHTKMSLIHNITNHVMKQASTKSTMNLSPALVETYSRLLVYSEIESLGIKVFVTSLLPTVFRSHAWGVLHTLLEMFSYRLHHFQPHYRIQLLNHLHYLTAVPQTNQIQLHLCVESATLKLIAGMGSAEVQPQLSRLQSEPKSMLSNESEELNKVLVLTIARAIHITGSDSLSGTWCKEILTTINQHTPLSWSSFTLKCFPNVLVEFFSAHQSTKENKAQLKRSVEEEYRKWKTMSNESDIISHFSLQGSSPLFLCLLWKMLLDNDRISTIAYEILDRIGARALSAHLRTFADFLVFEFANSVGGNFVNKYIDALNDLVWKCHVIQLDRLILCLALRSFEGNEAQVCFFIIHMLLLRPNDLKNRVYDFVKDNSPEHWKQSDWHEKHLLFHRVYEEKFYFEGLHDRNTQKSEHTYLPVYFGNVCLRFLPVMDIVIHRFLELPTVPVSIETLLDQLGCLYKFHDHPLTYLYNTLHYYEQKLRDRPPLKKKLVATVVGSLKDIRPEGWALTDDCLQSMQSNAEEWIPEHEYYVKLIGRMVDTLAGKSPFPHTDWRFNEFPNQGAHALHVTCIELMCLPISSKIVGNALLDLILRGRTIVMHTNILAWINAVGLVMSALPEAYMCVLNDRIFEVLQSPMIVNTPQDIDIFKILDFAGTYNSMSEMPCSYVIPLAHSVWYHASIGQICYLPQLFKEKFKPVVKTESQLIFLCHLVGPFLQRFYIERTRCVMEITVELYEMLENVDKNCEKMKYINPICDLLKLALNTADQVYYFMYAISAMQRLFKRHFYVTLSHDAYHIKYMFTGDAIKSEIEKVIKNLRPPIQRILRFMTHLNIEEILIP